MRHRGAFSYRITRIGPVPPVLEFIQQQARMSSKDAYGSLNMGAGYAFFVEPGKADLAVQAASAAGVPAWIAGHVEAGPKRVLIEPISVEFAGDELQLRA